MSPPLIQSYKNRYAQQLHGANTFNAVCGVCVCFYECYISYAWAVDVNYCTYMHFCYCLICVYSTAIGICSRMEMWVVILLRSHNVELIKTKEKWVCRCRTLNRRAFSPLQEGPGISLNLTYMVAMYFAFIIRGCDDFCVVEIAHV